MKKIVPVDDNLNDDDITQLFDSQSISVPDDLKALILAQAELNTEEKSPRTSGLWARGFAVAATVLIAVIITPMLLREPALSLSDQVQAPELQKSSRTMPVQSDSMEAVADTHGGVAGEATSVSARYRLSIDTWREQIEELIEDGDKQKALEEYELFKEQHPQQAEIFKPDFNMQEN